MRPRRAYNLKKPRLRQSWNKFNLYNLWRARDILVGPGATYYQQKWAAKSASRAYHGQQIKEGQWERMFTPKLKAVVPMDFRYLATQDGSEQAAGRGSGKEKDYVDEAKQLRAANHGMELSLKSLRDGTRTPWMHMTYAPMERRLDTAIFRALFASSISQARQFAVGGHVKVNGKQMIFPGYLLNPGDMFQVDPDKVLYATGVPKSATPEARAGRDYRKRLQEAKQRREEKRAEARAKAAESKEPMKKKSPRQPTITLTPEEEAIAEEKRRLEIRRNLNIIVEQARKARNDRPANNPTARAKTPARRKIELRELQKKVKALLNKVRVGDVSELESKVGDFMKELSISGRGAGVSRQDYVAQKEQAESRSPPAAQARSSPSSPAPEVAIAAALPQDQSSSANADADAQQTYRRKLTPKEREEREDTTKALIMGAMTNPIDARKPYATPWRPRPFMSAFAFIPSYLEVNQNICSAVYLRHPVARPGFSEIPSPFNIETSQLAFNWYLRRR